LFLQYSAISRRSSDAVLSCRVSERRAGDADLWLEPPRGPSSDALEDKFSSKPPLPLATATAETGIRGDQSGSDPPKRAAVAVVGRVIEMRSIRNTERLGL